MSAREAVSATVITLNEQANLARCLRSVAWADEIVVVDSGSTDRTLEIAEEHGARVFRQDWPGYVAQKNFALDRAAHRWVLSLDADEWVTAAGAAEIRRVLAAPAADGYAVNRRSAFAGAFLRGGWSPDWQLRLFRRDRGRFAGGRVHEAVCMDAGSRVDRLRERLPHHAYRSISDYVLRLDRYTTLAAATLRDQGRRPSWSRLLLSPPAAFCKTFILKRGYRDGVRGLLVAAGSAYYVLVKYGKLWEFDCAKDPELDAPDGREADS